MFLSFIIFKTIELNALFTRTALMSLSRVFDETNNVFCSTNLTRIDSFFVSNTSKPSVLLPSLTFPRVFGPNNTFRSTDFDGNGLILPSVAAAAAAHVSAVETPRSNRVNDDGSNSVGLCLAAPSTVLTVPIAVPRVHNAHRHYCVLPTTTGGSFRVQRTLSRRVVVVYDINTRRGHGARARAYRTGRI